MSIAELATLTKFHLSLNVSDVGRSVAFYQALFGLPAANVRHDYAKFELDEPPVVLSLIPASVAQGGALNHLGLRLASATELVEVQARLEAAGMPTQREEGVDCCYSRQTKFWIADPDRNLWEIYILLDTPEEEDHDHPPCGLPVIQQAIRADAAGPATEPTFWQHFLTSPLPDRIPHDDASLDEVRLEGAFNMAVEPDAFQAFLGEVSRVLRPGGRVLVHGLVGDRPFPGPLPTLPGPAAWVQHVPLEDEPLQKLAEAGFVAAQITKLAERPNFTLQGVEMREMKLVAFQPNGCCAGVAAYVVYKGPLGQVVDDDGHVFPRGQRVAVDPLTCMALKCGPVAEQFVFLPAASALPVMGCCP